MPISPNEMKKRALSFSKEWANATNEEAEAKEFLIQFLNIFHITRRKVAKLDSFTKNPNSSIKLRQNLSKTLYFITCVQTN